jgi:hypothetical protein
VNKNLLLGLAIGAIVIAIALIVFNVARTGADNAPKPQSADKGPGSTGFGPPESAKAEMRRQMQGAATRR